MEQKTDRPGIFKVREGILINKDTESLNAYKKRRQSGKRMLVLEKDLQALKADMQEIKSLLKDLLK